MMILTPRKGGAELQVDKEALDRLCILWSQFDKSGTGSVEVAELRRVMGDLGAADAGDMEVALSGTLPPRRPAPSL